MRGDALHDRVRTLGEAVALLQRLCEQYGDDFPLWSWNDGMIDEGVEFTLKPESRYDCPDPPRIEVA